MATASTYISNRPSFWEQVKITFEIIGYSRAAAELARQGLHNEAKFCMMQIKDLKASR